MCIRDSYRSTLIEPRGFGKYGVDPFEEEKKIGDGIAWWRYKAPMEGYEYNLLGLNEFGDMFPRPRRSPWWPTTTADYNSQQAKNYNLRENSNDPYVGGNGFYSFLGHGELPPYLKLGSLQLQNTHTVPKPPTFYEYEGFERVPFGYLSLIHISEPTRPY